MPISRRKRGGFLSGPRPSPRGAARRRTPSPERLPRPSRSTDPDLAIFRGAYLLAACRSLSGVAAGGYVAPVAACCLDYLAIVATEVGIASLRAEILASAECVLCPDHDESVAWPEPDAQLRHLRAELRPYAEPAMASDLGETLDRLVWNALTRGRGFVMRSGLAQACHGLRAGELGWMLGSAHSLRQWCERVSVPCGPIRVHRSVDLEGFAHRLARIVTHRLAGMGLPPGERVAADDPRGLDELARALEALAGQGGEGATALGAELVSLGDRGYAPLSADRYAVLTARWGLDGAIPQTLAEIGARRGTTREAVRGLERRASACLRRLPPPEEQWLRTVLSPLIFAQLAGGELHAATSALSFSHLEPWLRRLAHWLFERDSPWIDAYTVAHGESRISAFVDADVLRADSELESRLPLPLPSDARFPRSHSPIESALRAMLAGGQLLDGYALPERPTPRDRRAVRLTKLFEERAPAFLPLQEIVALYRARRAEDRCTAKDLVLALDASPHLFVQGARGRWMSVRHALEVYAARGRFRPSAHVAPRQAVGDRHGESIDARVVLAGIGTCTPDLEDALDASTGTVHERLAAALGIHGVLDAAGLREALPDVPATSIGFASGFDHELDWFAPGLLARSRDLAMLAAEPPPAFFDNRQVARLAQARRAGEHDALYPAWTPSNEHALTSWALLHAGDAPDYPSLLATCDLSRWPIEDAERPRWEARQSHVRYALDREPDYDGARVHDTPRLAYRVLSDLLERESTNWVRVNRLIRERTDSKGAIWPLVFLIAVGVLDAPARWQQPHAVRRARQRVVWERLSRHLANTGRLTWGCAPVRKLMRDARASLEDSAVRGWVAGVAFEQLLTLVDEQVNRESMSKG